MEIIRPKILMVDDRPENLTALEVILKGLDVDLVKVLSGNDGLRETLREDFALALVDVQMPGMDGYEFVELLHMEKKNRYLPVIFITAIYHDEMHLVKGIEKGAVDFITKPIVANVLRGKVQIFLDLYRQRKYLQVSSAALAASEERYRLANENLVQINSRLTSMLEAISELQLHFHSAEIFGAMLLEKFVSHLHADCGSLYFVEAEELRLVSAHDLADPIDSIPFPLPAGSIFAKKIASNKHFLIGEISKYSKDELACIGLGNFSKGSILTYALPDNNGEIIGLIILHREMAPAFTRQDREIGLILSAYVSGTLLAVKADEKIVMQERVLSVLTRSMLDVIGQECFEKIIHVCHEYFNMEYCVLGRVVNGDSVQSIATYWDGEPGVSLCYQLDGTPCQKAIEGGLITFRQNVASLFPENQSLQDLKIESYIGAALHNSKGEPIGVLCLFSRKPISEEAYAEEILKTIAARASAELGRHLSDEKLITLNRELDRRVKERTAELEAIQDKMILQAHEAGMAQMAAEVLHNIGNAITPAHISAQRLFDTLQKSPLCELLATALKDFQQLFAQSPSVSDESKTHLAQIAEQLPEKVGDELKGYSDILHKICAKHEHIENIITLQNNYTRLPGNFEYVDLNQIVDDAIQILEDSLGSHNVQVTKNYGRLEKIRVEKSKMIQVLVNLIKNGQEATYGNQIDDRQLTVSTRMEETGYVVCTIKDNGSGFTADEKDKLFTYGYTSKKKGFGLGLHSCANLLIAAGGEIEAHSQGPGCGAEFLFRIPVSTS